MKRYNPVVLVDRRPSSKIRCPYRCLSALS